MFEKAAEEYAESTKTEKEIEVLNIAHVWGRESLSPEERYLLEGINKAKKEIEGELLKCYSGYTQEIEE